MEQGVKYSSKEQVLQKFHVLVIHLFDEDRIRKGGKRKDYFQDRVKKGIPFPFFVGFSDCLVNKF